MEQVLSTVSNLATVFRLKINFGGVGGTRICFFFMQETRLLKCSQIIIYF